MIRLCSLLAVALLAVATPVAAESFEFKDGDRVVLLGNTFIERAQSSGYLETALTRAYPDRSLLFRNLGWSGDTVFGHARAGFGKVEDGFRELKEAVTAAKPTVIVVGYGMNASFKGEAGLPEFLKGLDRLLDTLEATQARIVILSPIRHEFLDRPLPEPARHNAQLELYTDALAEVARKRGYPFVDLFRLLAVSTQEKPLHPRTDNGIHLTPYGYWEAAFALQQGLGIEPKAVQVNINLGKAPQTKGTKLTDYRATAKRVEFALTDDVLPVPPAPRDWAPEKASRQAARTLQIRGLAAGKYAITIDGKVFHSATAKELAAGVALTTGPEFFQAEALRQAILDKNSLFFHRWRPQNWTYLYGFRKHEQGKNAVEIPKFDPLIAQKEKRIAELRVPQAHRYVIQPTN